MNTNLLIPDGDRQRLLACTHNAPHDIYGWHPHGDGSIIRTLSLIHI